MKTYFFILLILISNGISSQNIIVGFYNCENYYDTTNQIKVLDEDFIPNSQKKYNSEVFEIKTKHLANVIYGVGKIDNSNGITLMGLAEIENKEVLDKLISEPLLKKYHLRYIHFDSKDLRGVDVALIYNPSYFTPYQYKPFSLSDKTHFNDYATRDILYVKGSINGKWVHILVNHWPSRRGGILNSNKKRFWASQVCKKIIDSITKVDPVSKFIVMGDFNDNPNDKSIRNLNLTNPFLPLFNKGIGSIAFNDSWNLFDQILLSINWRDTIATESNNKFLPDSTSFESLTHYKPIIYTKPDMIENRGKYQGYPKRTYNGDRFRGGYSDHFPVALIFKPKNAEKPLK